MKQLIQKITELKNPTVVGLDPMQSVIPTHLLKLVEEASEKDRPQAIAQAVLTYNKGLIDAIFDIVPAVKPQCAYYEALGWRGMQCLQETIEYAKEKGMYVIADGKRNDIGSTMQAYGQAFLGAPMYEAGDYHGFCANALTVNGYLGTDGIKPLLDIMADDAGKGIFVLVKTSNPSSGELQDQMLGDRPLYAAMGDMCETWGLQTAQYQGYSQVGAVVGATYPEQLTELRARLAHTFFLVPGYGAQGGGAKDVAGAFDENGLGAIINSSRGIIGAWKGKNAPESYAEIAREEAIKMREDLLSAVPKIKA